MYLVSVLDKHPVVASGLKILFAKIDNNPFYIDKIFNSQKEFLDNIERWKSDILLTELQPKERKSIELVKEVKTRYPDSKIIIFTGNYSKENILSAIRINVHGIISKTVSIPTLISCLNKIRQSGKFLAISNDELLAHNIFKNKNLTRSNQKQLTMREKEVINLITEGSSNKEMSEVLNISVSTVEFHKKNIYYKLEVSNVSELLKKVYMGENV